MAHLNEKIDFTVEVFIVYGKKVLLRMHDKYKIWLSVGGHIDLGEDPNEAALREVKEEVGLEVELWSGNQKSFYHRENPAFRELIPPVSLNRHAISPTHEHVTLVYLGKAKSDNVKVEHDGDRSDDWGWFTKEELKNLELRDDIRFYAELALDTLRV